VGRTVESAPATAGLSALVGAIVTQWWRPCVGVELGAILTGAPDDPWRFLLPTVGFMLGVSIPLFALGLVVAAWKPATRVATTGSWIGCALAIVLAASVIAGHHGEIVARLVAWSQ
jgi:cytochrome c-type biogenesis protein